MRRLALVSLVVAAACTASDPDLVASGTTSDAGVSDAGAVEDAGDGGETPASACTGELGAPSEGPFANINEDNSVAEGVSLTSDELTLYFSTTRAKTGSGVVQFDLWTASRATRDLPFDPPEPLPGFDSRSTADRWPVVDLSGGVLYFARYIDQNTDYDVMRTVRDVNGRWTTTERLAKIARPSADRPSAFTAPNLLWWVNGYDVRRVPISEDGSVGQEELNGDFSSMFAPVETSDGTTIYYGWQTGARGLDIYRATEDATGRFTVKAAIPSLALMEDQTPGAVSSDGCRLYLATTTKGTLPSAVPAGGQLQMAERGK